MAGACSQSWKAFRKARHCCEGQQLAAAVQPLSLQAQYHVVASTEACFGKGTSASPAILPQAVPLEEITRSTLRPWRSSLRQKAFDDALDKAESAWAAQSCYKISLNHCKHEKPSPPKAAARRSVVSAVSIWLLSACSTRGCRRARRNHGNS